MAGVPSSHCKQGGGGRGQDDLEDPGEYSDWDPKFPRLVWLGEGQKAGGIYEISMDS